MQPNALVPRLLLWLVLLLLPATAPAVALGNECGGCPAASSAQLTEEILPHVKSRDGLFGKVADTVHFDKGDCIVAMEGAPKITPLFFWLEERAKGEVWNCPHSKSHDTITAEAHQSDSSSWTVTGTTGIKLSTGVAEVKGEIARGNTTGVAITEVTRVSKTIMPAWCRRVPWTGWFLLGRFKAVASFSIDQEWAWWTKNSTTGDKVHAKGKLTVHCGSAEIEMERQAPLAGHFQLTEKGCNDPACGSVIPKHLGFFPPLPGDVDPPGEAEPAETEPETAGEPQESSDLGDPPTGPTADPLAGDRP